MIVVVPTQSRIILLYYNIGHPDDKKGTSFLIIFISADLRQKSFLCLASTMTVIELL